MVKWLTQGVEIHFWICQIWQICQKCVSWKSRIEWIYRFCSASSSSKCAQELILFYHLTKIKRKHWTVVSEAFSWLHQILHHWLRTFASQLVSWKHETDSLKKNSFSLHLFTYSAWYTDFSSTNKIPKFTLVLLRNCLTVAVWTCSSRGPYLVAPLGTMYWTSVFICSMTRHGLFVKC